MPELEIRLSNPSINDYSRYPRVPEHLLANARVIADRWAGLELWPKNAVIAEVGVARGDFTQSILACCKPSKFLAIDLFALHEVPILWGRASAELFDGRTHEDYYRRRFSEEISAGTVQVIKGNSASAINVLEDGSVDVFYVDADHIYESVRGDLEVIIDKVKPGGIIVMNDYIPADTFSNEPLGVIQATNEFMIDNEWEMVYIALAPMMYCDVALRKCGSIDGVLAGARVAQGVGAQDLSVLVGVRRSRSWRVTTLLRAVSRRIFLSG